MVNWAQTVGEHFFMKPFQNLSAQSNAFPTMPKLRKAIVFWRIVPLPREEGAEKRAAVPTAFLFFVGQESAEPHVDVRRFLPKAQLMLACAFLPLCFLPWSASPALL